MAFRIYAKNLFFTFAQCFLPKEQILQHLKNLLHDYRVIYIAVCEELHADGNPHVHAMVQCELKFQTTNPRFFDITDNLHDNRIFHPSFESLNSPTASQKYIKKDGNYIEEGEFSSRRRSPKKDLHTTWTEILNSSTDEQSFYQAVKDKKPQDYVLRWPAITAFAKDHYQRRFIPFTPQFVDFPHLPPHVRAWANRNILCVSSEFIRLNLCHSCYHDTLSESENTINSMHHFYCDTCRSPMQSPAGPNHSTSTDLLAQEKLPGPEVWDYTIISQGI